jgi:hypothetical protein
VLADFSAGSLLDAERVSNQIREAPFILSTTLHAGLSAAKFPVLTEMMLEEMLNNAGV